MAEPETAAPAVEPASSKIDAIVDKWFCDMAYNSIVSRDTPGFNHVFAAKEDLKKRLAAAG